MSAASPDTKLPRYEGPDAEVSDATYSKREFLVAAGATVAAAVVGDQLGGVADRLEMKRNPEATIYENRDSNIITFTVPGNRNNGGYMGELLHRYAFGDSNMVAVSWAEDNIDPLKLAALIKSSMDSINLPDPSQRKIAFYLNSIAAAVFVPVFEILQANGITADLVIFDSGLRTREGLRGINEVPARLRVDKAGHSRVINFLQKLLVGSSIPPAGTDKDPKVDPALDYGHRWHTVNCDSITQSSQVAALDIPLKPGRLRNFAAKLVYFKTRGTNAPGQPDNGIDPLVESELSARQIGIDYGQTVEMHVDYKRPHDSHGNGPIWPDGLRDYFTKFFGIKPKQ